MIDHFAAGQRRSIALALLALLTSLVWVGAINPLIELAEARSDERFTELRALSRDRALLSQAPQLRESLQDAEKSARWSRFYSGPGPDKALVEMQADLRELLKAPNNPTSMATLPATTKGHLTHISVKVTLSMPIDQWTQALARVSSHSRLVMLDKLTIQAPDYQVVDTNPVLTIQAEFVGYMLAAASGGT